MADDAASSPASLHKKIIGVAIHPVLTRLEGFDDRVARSMEMFRGVLVFGLIAASDMAADHAETKMHPGIPHFQAFLAAVWGAGFNVFYLIEMRAVCCHSNCKSNSDSIGFPSLFVPKE